MLPFRKILFPVDYSAACEAVVPYVRDAVAKNSAELTLVHAYAGAAFPYVDLPSANPEWVAEITSIEEKRLADFARERFPGLAVTTVVDQGDASTIIEAVAAARGIDLVMMPTHGLGPVRRVLLGSVTSKVLHDSSVAVWTGTGGVLAAHKPALPYRSVLCALDLTDESKAVLVAGAAIAKQYGARLSLVHVVDTPRSAYEFDFAMLRKEVMDAADRQLRDLKHDMEIDAPHQVLDDSITAGVRQAAVDCCADLILTGRGHVHGTVSRLLSHLYPLVRESPCPVISI